MKFKKGDHVVYTGEYDPSVPDSAKYPPGVIERFKTRFDEKVAIVKLDHSGLYADWPVTEIRMVDDG